MNDVTKKEREKQQYERVKSSSVINCKCGSNYVAFRDYHIVRHVNSKFHQSYLNRKLDNAAKAANMILHKTC